MPANYWSMFVVVVGLMVMLARAQESSDRSDEHMILSLQSEKVKLLEEYAARYGDRLSDNGTSVFQQMLTEHLEFSQTVNEVNEHHKESNNSVQVSTFPIFSKNVKSEFRLDLAELVFLKQYQTRNFGR